MNERKPTPFCHIFAADGANFVYDVNSNELLEVEPVLAAVLPLIGTMGTAEILARLAGAFPADQVRRAVETVARAQDSEGLFLPGRPVLIPPDAGQDEPGRCDSNLQHLVLTVTDRCNLRCRYCLYGSRLPGVRGHGRATMDRSVALRALAFFLDRSAADRPPAISFYGGEPLLAMDLIRKVVAEVRRHPRGREAVLAVDTNGTLLDASARDFVVRERLQVQVSLDGPPRIHDRHRRWPDGRGTFAQVCANVEALARLDPEAADRLRFVVTLAPPADPAAVDAFYADFPPFARAGISRRPFVKVNVADVRGLPAQEAKSGAAAIAGQRSAAREAYYRTVAGGGQQPLGPVLESLVESGLRRLYNRPLVPLGTTFTPGAVCRPGRRRLHVTVDGRYQPCERTGEAMTLGSTAQCIRPEAVRSVRMAFFAAVAETCRECWALRLCRVCYAHQAAFPGRPWDLPAKVCPAVREATQEDLALLARLLKLGPQATAHLARGASRP